MGIFLLQVNPFFKWTRLNWMKLTMEGVLKKSITQSQPRKWQRNKFECSNHIEFEWENKDGGKSMVLKVLVILGDPGVSRQLYHYSHVEK